MTSSPSLTAALEAARTQTGVTLHELAQVDPVLLVFLRHLG